MAFSNKLYELRKKNGLSQEELANKLNVTRQTVSKWELGESTPEMEKLVVLSDLFSISLDELVLDRSEEKSEISQYGEKTLGQVVDERLLTEENKKKVRKGMKIFGIILAVLFAVDIISMFIYFVLFGAPS